MATEYQQKRWSLDDLVPAADEKVIQSYLDDLEAHVVLLEAGKNSLSPEIPADVFQHLLDIYEQQSAIANRLSAYVNLWFFEDTQNPAVLNLRGRIDQHLGRSSNRSLFFTLWFKELPEEAAQRLIRASGDRAYMLENLRRFKPHTLSEAEERLITLKDVDGIDALVEVYDLVTNKFVFHLDVEGEMKHLTRDQLSAMLRHPSAARRAAAYQELLRVYAENETLLSQIYVHRVRDWHTEGEVLRHFAEPISYRNLINDIPDAVVDILLDTCRANAAVFQRYFRLKASWLGMEKLHRFDIYAPLSSSEKKIDFPQAVDMILTTLENFSPDVAAQVERVFKENHIDAENRSGKRGGALCYAALPELTPWVLVNYAGQARDVATLAHELGHALHSMQSAGHSILAFRPSLPLAETASVFSEMLLTQKLVESEGDVMLRRELLARAVDDAFATILRQAYFTIFERQAHQIINQGGSVKDLCEQYYQNLVEQFGDAVELVDEFRWEWISIPHIYKSPFYTYAYSFGQLLVLALFQQYQIQGAAFVPRYLKVLAYGGSAAPAAILAEAGIDITTPAFWQGGFDALAKMIQQLEEL